VLVSPTLTLVRLANLAAGGNNFNDFAENQPIKFRAVSRPAGCFRQWAIVIISGREGVIHCTC